MYRMTNRTMPEKSSAFMGSVLLQLRTFMGSLPTDISREKRRVWATQAITTVSERYDNIVLPASTHCRRFAHLVEEMLSVLKRTQESLKLLQQWRPGEKGGDAEAKPATESSSDVDKIYCQLRLGTIWSTVRVLCVVPYLFADVQEFGRQVGEFDIQPSLLPAYTALLHLVTTKDES